MLVAGALCFLAGAGAMYVLMAGLWTLFWS
jgi:hypothetical protein